MDILICKNNTTNCILTGIFALLTEKILLVSKIYSFFANFLTIYFFVLKCVKLSIKLMFKDPRMIKVGLLCAPTWKIYFFPQETDYTSTFLKFFLQVFTEESFV